MALGFTIAAAVAFLAIAIVAAARRSRTPLAIPLSLMCVGLFAYAGLDALASLTRHPRWDWLSYAFASLLSIPTFELTVGFVGMRKPLRLWRLLFAAYFVVLAAANVTHFVTFDPQVVPPGELWPSLMLAGLAPAIIACAVMLYRHAKRSPAEEKARTRLLVASLVLGVGGSATDLALIALGTELRLSAFALTACSLLLAALVLRARILEGVTALTLFTAGVIAALTLFAQIAVFALADMGFALMTFGTLVVLLAAVAASRPLLVAVSEQRAKMRYLATLGRFAAQMAHDLRNPLAAIHGAAQFLQEEHRQGRPLAPHVEFIDMIVERVERLERVIKDYQRMGRVELQRQNVDVNKLVSDVLAGRAIASGDEVRVDMALDRTLPRCSADRDLLVVALENVVRNAQEAMPEGGDLHVQTETLGETIRVEIRDSGEGMDARARERAFEDFYTTKTEGSGLGLAFVARVIEAHGGKIRLDSELGSGTTVAIDLPSQAP